MGFFSKFAVASLVGTLSLNDQSVDARRHLITDEEQRTKLEPYRQNENINHAIGTHHSPLV